MAKKNGLKPQEAADAWNAAVKIGGHVMYSEVIGVTEPVRHATASAAEVLSGHSTVVWLQGKSGCVQVSHCRPVQVQQRELLAYCFDNGVIQFGDIEPAGAVTIARGPESELRAEMDVACRHGHNKGVLLVPGVPESPTQQTGMTAVLKFCEWMKTRGAAKRGVIKVGAA
jgi:hypothetical protein